MNLDYILEAGAGAGRITDILFDEFKHFEILDHSATLLKAANEKRPNVIAHHNTL